MTFPNVTFRPSYVPVALFVGGTSGIGQAMAEAFARHTNGNAHIILIGRNKEAADKIIASLPQHPASRYEFVQCDASLMTNVHAVTAALRARLPRVNFLVLSPGFLTLRGRNETAEGLDHKLALNYYARWKFTNDLMPALEEARRSGESASVMSVLGAGHDGPIDIKDLGLKRTYSVRNVMLTAPTYNDLMMEEFAIRHSSVSYTHIFPGVVRTPMLTPSHWALKPLTPLLFGLFYPISVSASDCANYMWSALFAADKEPGRAWRRGAKGEDLGPSKYSSEEARRALWEHSVTATKVQT